MLFSANSTRFFFYISHTTTVVIFMLIIVVIKKLLFYYLIIACLSPIHCIPCYTAIFNKFIEKFSQIFFCKFHQIIVLHLTDYHCGDYHIALLFYYLIIVCQNHEYLHC